MDTRRPGLGVRSAPVATDHRIDPGIRTDCRIVDAPLAADRVEEWVDLLTALAGPKLLRMKGIFNIDGHHGPVILHAVQHVVHPPELLPRWPSDDFRSRIVLITRDLDPDIVASLWAVLLDGSSLR
jgi:G3E family GTPase